MERRETTLSRLRKISAVAAVNEARTHGASFLCFCELVCSEEVSYVFASR